MAELINVKDEDGAQIVINLDFVVQIRPGDRADMSLVTIADGKNVYDIYVHGAPSQIAKHRRLGEGDTNF
jgi:hypothetical protein